MKKYFSYLSMALIAFVFASCGLKGNHTSSGRAYELLVVVDHGVWDRAAGRALHDVLDSDMPGLPQSEPSFRIMYTSPKDYDSTLKLIRNIIIVDIKDIYTKASFKYAKDVYANPQMILTIQAPNEEEFQKFVEENKQTIVDFFTRAEMNRQISMLEEKHSNFISQKVDSLFGCDIWLPAELANSKTGKDFFWASTNTGTADRNFVMYSYPYTDKDTFTKEYLLSWFPNLPSYQTFNYRLNLMSEAINELVKHLITFFKPTDCDSMISLIDSMPIITCAGKNKTGKVATEIATKGYCSTKNMYYFGLKLHTLAFRREGTIPFPEMIILSSAEENDLTVLKREAADSLINRYIFADKIYSDFSFWGNKQQEQGVTMMTPVKAIKGEEPIITQREKAGRDLFSTAVSKVRQPIESFFNWLNEKTNIQRAMKVRSTSGLLVHTMGKIAIAFIYLIF